MTGKPMDRPSLIIGAVLLVMLALWLFFGG
jgi:hypothetical protein